MAGQVAFCEGELRVTKRRQRSAKRKEKQADGGGRML